MRTDEYKETQLLIARISEVACHIPIEEFIEDLNRAAEEAKKDDPMAFSRAEESINNLRAQCESIAKVKEIRLKFREHQPENVRMNNSIAAAAWIGSLR